MDTNIKLASKLDRLLASILDTIITFILLSPMYYWYYLKLSEHVNIAFNYKENMRELYLLELSSLIPVAVLAYFLLTSSDTIGKKIMKIKVVNIDGNKPKSLNIFYKYFLAIFIILLLDGIAYLSIPNNLSINQSYLSVWTTISNIVQSIIKFYFVIEGIVFLFSKQNISIRDRVFNTRVIKK